VPDDKPLLDLEHVEYLLAKYKHEYEPPHWRLTLMRWWNAFIGKVMRR
jgi:hypothetical protein